MKKSLVPDPQRQLMIKTKACQRLIKEVSYYQDEVVENEGKLKMMKTRNKNHHDIKKFQEVLGESYMMVPDSKNRLEQTLSDLTTYLKSPEVMGLETNEWYIQAHQLITKENVKIEDTNNDNLEEQEETNVDDLREGEAF